MMAKQSKEDPEVFYNTFNVYVREAGKLACFGTNVEESKEPKNDIEDARLAVMEDLVASGVGYTGAVLVSIQGGKK